MGIKIIQSFAKGDEVPSWLLDIEPTEGGGTRPDLRFGFACHVVEVSMGYFVVNDSDSGPDAAYYATAGSGAATLFASSRTVYTPMRLMRTGGPDDDHDPGGEPSPVAPLDRITA